MSSCWHAARWSICFCDRKVLWSDKNDCSSVESMLRGNRNGRWPSKKWSPKSDDSSTGSVHRLNTSAEPLPAQHSDCPHYPWAQADHLKHCAQSPAWERTNSRRLTLLQHHRNARTAWARRYQRATNAELNRILWTDEVRFTLSRPDGQWRVYRCAGERYANACVEEYESQGGGGVMAWGGITGTHWIQLVILNGAITGHRYRDEVVRPHIVPFLQQHGPGLTLQQDNARPHVAGVVQDDLHVRQIPTMLWPARSPDLSPTAHVWDEIKRRLHHRPHPPQTLQQLRQAVIEECQNIPQAFI